MSKMRRFIQSIVTYLERFGRWPSTERDPGTSSPCIESTAESDEARRGRLSSSPWESEDRNSRKRSTLSLFSLFW